MAMSNFGVDRTVDVSGRLPYHAPVLRRYGSVAELTASNVPGGTPNDGLPSYGTAAPAS
jgi:hypothetical protein